MFVYRCVAWFLLGTAVSAHAAPNCPSAQTIFSCTTAKSKQIQVCDLGKNLRYHFGKANAPELVLNIPREQASTQPWAGIGRYMSYSVDLPNGDTTYSVFWSVDRLDEKHSVSAGVNVLVKDKIVATVNCSEKAAPIVQQMEDISLKKTP